MANYWQQRSAQKRLFNAEKVGKRSILEVRDIYEQALGNINDYINSVYVNYAKKVGLDVGELTQVITGSERANFLKSVQANMQKLGMNVEKIYQPNYLYRLHRLDMMKQQIYWELQALAPKIAEVTGKNYAVVIDETYRNAIMDRQKEFGGVISPAMATINKGALTEIMQEKWRGRNYSDTVWGDAITLSEKLPAIIGGALISGASSDKTQRIVRQLFDSSEYASARLIRTETNYFQNQAELQSYIDDGIERYQFDAVMDMFTSNICQHENGKVYDVNDARVGINYPPLHPNCRSTTFPLFAGEKKYIRKRKNVFESAEQEKEVVEKRKKKEIPQIAKQVAQKPINDYSKDLNSIAGMTGAGKIKALGDLIKKIPDDHPMKDAIKHSAEIMGWKPTIPKKIEIKIPQKVQEIIKEPELSPLSRIDQIYKDNTRLFNVDQVRQSVQNLFEKGQMSEFSLKANLSKWELLDAEQKMLSDAKKEIEKLMNANFKVDAKMVGPTKKIDIPNTTKDIELDALQMKLVEKHNLLITKSTKEHKLKRGAMAVYTSQYDGSGRKLIFGSGMAKKEAEYISRAFEHEFGHFVDATNTENGKVVQWHSSSETFNRLLKNENEKMAILQRRSKYDLPKEFTDQDIDDYLHLKTVRKGQYKYTPTVKFIGYLESRTEMFAETYSYYQNDKEWLKKNAPSFYKYHEMLEWDLGIKNEVLRGVPQKTIVQESNESTKVVEVKNEQVGQLKNIITAEQTDYGKKVTNKWEQNIVDRSQVEIHKIEQNTTTIVGDKDQLKKWMGKDDVVEVFHGTRAEYKSNIKNEGMQIGGNSWFGTGRYFAKVRSTAKDYGDAIVKAYVKPQNVVKISVGKKDNTVSIGGQSLYSPIDHEKVTSMKQEIEKIRKFYESKAQAKIPNYEKLSVIEQRQAMKDIYKKYWGTKDHFPTHDGQYADVLFDYNKADFVEVDFSDTALRKKGNYIVARNKANTDVFILDD